MSLLYAGIINFFITIATPVIFLINGLSSFVLSNKRRSFMLIVPTTLSVVSSKTGNEEDFIQEISPLEYMIEASMNLDDLNDANVT